MWFMSRDQVVGLGLLAISAVVIIAYGYLIFAPPNITILGIPLDMFLLKLTAFLAVLVLFGILAWVGYALATTPPPKPIEEIEREVEEALRNIEAELSKEESREGATKQ